MTRAPDSAPIRYAWYGRVSTEDEQNPTLSFPANWPTPRRGPAPGGSAIKRGPDRRRPVAQIIPLILATVWSNVGGTPRSSYALARARAPT